MSVRLRFACVFAVFVAATMAFTPAAGAQPTDAQVVAAVAAKIDTYMASIGKAPATLVVIPSGESIMDDPCNKGHADTSEEAMWYCSANTTIYVGMDMARKFRSWSRLGVHMALWHENGHHLQHLAGQPMLEDQADCHAGAALQRGSQADGLNVGPGDLPGFARVVHEIARPWDEARTETMPHGNVFERSGALIAGFTGGVQACNNWGKIVP